MLRVALTLVTLVLMAFSAVAQAPPIKIGFASAMSGPAAITGEGVRWGATLAVEEINAKGGVMGRKLEAYFADNKAQPGEAVSAVRKLADVDQVDVIIGQTHSGACLGAMRSEEHTSELQSLAYLVCRLLLEKKKKKRHNT